MWEDDANKNGGRFVFRVPKKKRTTSKHWEDLLLAVIGEQFDCGDEICGIVRPIATICVASQHLLIKGLLCIEQVASMKYNEDLISVWNRDSENTEAKRKIEETMRQVFGLPAGTFLEYKPHASAITGSNNPNPSNE